MPPVDDAPAPAAMLGALNERRFALLVTMMLVDGPLTTTEIADRLPPRSRGSLHRDLAALERVGLLRGDPATTSRQQGQRVSYQPNRRRIIDDFEALVGQLRDAL